MVRMLQGHRFFLLFLSLFIFFSACQKGQKSTATTSTSDTARTVAQTADERRHNILGEEDKVSMLVDYDKIPAFFTTIDNKYFELGEDIVGRISKVLEKTTNLTQSDLDILLALFGREYNYFANSGEMVINMIVPRTAGPMVNIVVPRTAGWRKVIKNNVTFYKIFDIYGDIHLDFTSPSGGFISFLCENHDIDNDTVEKKVQFMSSKAEGKFEYDGPIFGEVMWVLADRTNLSRRQ